MPVLKYQPKVSVYALKWSGNLEELKEFPDFTEYTHTDDGTIHIYDNGVLKYQAAIGDYIVRGTTGHYFVVKSADFAEKYEPT